MEYQNEQGVLTAATACLYELVRNGQSKMMPTRLLASMVELVLHALEITRDQHQVFILNLHSC